MIVQLLENVVGFVFLLNMLMLTFQCDGNVQTVMSGLHLLTISRTANKASHTIEDAKQVAFSKNGECLSETYDNNFSPLSWRCSEGHEWNASFNNVKNNKTWCPYCA